MPIAFQKTKGIDGFDLGGPPHNLPSFDARGSVAGGAVGAGSTNLTAHRSPATDHWKQHKGTIPLVSQRR